MPSDSSGGSNSKAIVPAAEIQSPALDDDLESSYDDGVRSMHSSDLSDKPLQKDTFCLMDARRELAKAVILHDYPLSMIDHRGFKGLFECLFPVVSQNTLKRDISKIYSFNKDIAMGTFDETKSRIAITVDKWTSYDQTKSFIAITGHMIDNEWEVQRRMMRFINLPRTYTTELVVKLTVSCIFDWNVKSKISTIAIDDGFDEGLKNFLLDEIPSNLLFLGGNLLQMKCLARTMSLMVKEGFDVIESVIGKIRESILFWKDTPKRERELKAASKELSLTDSISKLVLDSVSKWNTTFLMLEAALLFKPVFYHLKNQESEYLCMPNEEEWELAKEICQKLRLFYKLVNHASKYRSNNQIFFDLFKTIRIMRKWVCSSNKLVRNVASKMLEIFDKYWNSVRDIFAVASVLDERYKLVAVEDCFEEIYGDNCQKEVGHIRRICYDLFNEYRCAVSLKKKKRSEDSSAALEDLDKCTLGFEAYIREKRKREYGRKPELDAYLEKDITSVNDSVGDSAVLPWWRYKDNPILKKMVRDIMAIPIFFVAPEHMFDIGDHRVLSPHRSRLDPTMVEKLMCSQSWLWTTIKGSYSVTNSYSWSTNDDYTVAERQATDEAVG